MNNRLSLEFVAWSIDADWIGSEHITWLWSEWGIYPLASFVESCSLPAFISPVPNWRHIWEPNVDLTSSMIWSKVNLVLHIKPISPGDRHVRSSCCVTCEWAWQELDCVPSWERVVGPKVMWTFANVCWWQLGWGCLGCGCLCCGRLGCGCLVRLVEMVSKMVIKLECMIQIVVIYTVS